MYDSNKTNRVTYVTLPSEQKELFDFELVWFGEKDEVIDDIICGLRNLMFTVFKVEIQQTGGADDTNKLINFIKSTSFDLSGVKQGVINFVDQLKTIRDNLPQNDIYVNTLNTIITLLGGVVDIFTDGGIENSNEIKILMFLLTAIETDDMEQINKFTTYVNTKLIKKTPIFAKLNEILEGRSITLLPALQDLNKCNKKAGRPQLTQFANIASFKIEPNDKLKSLYTDNTFSGEITFNLNTLVKLLGYGVMDRYQGLQVYYRFSTLQN